MTPATTHPWRRYPKGGRAPIAAEVIEQMKALRAEGKTNPQIQALLNLCKSTVDRYAPGGYKGRPRTKGQRKPVELTPQQLEVKIPATERKALRLMIEDKYTLPEMAAATGLELFKIRAVLPLLTA